MKYTNKQYEIAKKFREFYYKETNAEDSPLLEDGWWERMRYFTWDRWAELYFTGQGFLPQDRARKLTDEFFAAKENKVKTPSSYTFVSTDKDVDLLRIIREAPDAQFILIEKKNRNTNKVISHLLIHEKVLNNPTVKNLKIYELPVDRNWGVDSLGYFPGKSLIGTGYQGHYLCDYNYNVSTVRAEIEAVIKALNPKDTKTVVTVW